MLEVDNRTRQAVPAELRKAKANPGADHIGPSSHHYWTVQYSTEANYAVHRGCEHWPGIPGPGIKIEGDRLSKVLLGAV